MGFSRRERNNQKLKFGETVVGKVETSFVQPPFLYLCVFFGVRNLRVGNFVVGGACVVGSNEKAKVGVAKDVSAFRFIQ